MFGTSVSLVMCVMRYPLQLSLFVNVLLSGSLDSSYCSMSVFSFSLVYDPTNSSMDTTVSFHQCFQYDSGKHDYEKQPALGGWKGWTHLLQQVLVLVLLWFLQPVEEPPCRGVSKLE